MLWGKGVICSPSLSVSSLVLLFLCVCFVLFLLFFFIFVLFFTFILVCILLFFFHFSFSHSFSFFQFSFFFSYFFSFPLIFLLPLLHFFVSSTSFVFLTPFHPPTSYTLPLNLSSTTYSTIHRSSIQPSTYPLAPIHHPVHHLHLSTSIQAR